MSLAPPFQDPWGHRAVVVKHRPAAGTPRARRAELHLRQTTQVPETNRHT